MYYLCLDQYLHMKNFLRKYVKENYVFWTLIIESPGVFISVFTHEL